MKLHEQIEKLSSKFHKWAPVVKHPERFRRSDLKTAVKEMKKAISEKKKLEKKIGSGSYKGGYSTNEWYNDAGYPDEYEHIPGPGRLLEPYELRNVLMEQEEPRMRQIATARAKEDAKKGMFRQPLYLRQPNQAEIWSQVTGQGVVTGGDVLEDPGLYGGIYGNPYPFSFNYF